MLLSVHWLTAVAVFVLVKSGRRFSRNAVNASLASADRTRAANSMAYVGLGYEYWHNKYGNQPGVGTKVNAPQLQVELHF